MKYDPKGTTVEECEGPQGLEGDLCSRTDIKCSQSKDATDFLDASGAVIDVGNHYYFRICYPGGECKAP